ncbi:ATP-binding protein [Embleya sp. NPDC050154]|uniref:ATP-binding protein n=1 Tax=Embleya sp. NPDC050154 TaxID=3363988 RepID=UPI00378F4B3B
MDVLPGIECRTTWLPREPASAALARAHIVDACRAWGLDNITPVAVLAASELVTNSIIHTESALVGVVAWRDGRRFSVEVRDSDPAPPILRTPTRADDHGRGLRLVAEMCDQWGVLPADDGDGKAVWFSITGPIP